MPVDLSPNRWRKHGFTTSLAATLPIKVEERASVGNGQFRVGLGLGARPCHCCGSGRVLTGWTTWTVLGIDSVADPRTASAEGPTSHQQTPSSCEPLLLRHEAPMLHESAPGMYCGLFWVRRKARPFLVGWRNTCSSSNAVAARKWHPTQSPSAAGTGGGTGGRSWTRWSPQRSPASSCTAGGRCCSGLVVGGVPSWQQRAGERGTSGGHGSIDWWLFQVKSVHS